MKTNENLGFSNFLDSREISADGGRDDLTINLTLGKRGQQWRAYAYQWHHEQAASREGKRDECSARGTSPSEALRAWRLAALRRGWSAPGVEAAYSDAMDEAEELAETE
jgi:hypothetical protein